jgi:hypothetical protein
MSQTLVSKLAEIVSEIDHVEKRGRNEFHKYDYVKAADLANVVRDKLAARKIVMISDVLNSERFIIPGDKGDQQAVLLTVQYTFHDGESAETLSFRVPGCGADKGDKGVYKALTGSLKYALRNAFLIPDESDPENEDNDGKGPTQQEKAVLAFKQLNVSISMLEKKLGKPIHKATDTDMDTLQDLYKQLKAGTPVGDLFDVPAAPAAVEKPEVNHTPAEPKDEPRPGEKKRSSRPKKDEPAPEAGQTAAATEPPATNEEKLAIKATLNQFQEKIGSDKLKAFILKTANATDTKLVSKPAWDAVIAKLKEAEAAGTLKELIAA